jgi:hypothetical protein
MFLNPLTLGEAGRLQLRNRSPRRKAVRQEGDSLFMGLDLRIKQENGYLFIGIIGEYSLMESRDLIHRVKEESKNSGYQNVLLDTTGLAGSIPHLDMFELGVHCAEVWKAAFRVAIISRAGGINKLFEDVAANRGARVLVVANEGAAIQWLDGNRREGSTWS